MMGSLRFGIYSLCTLAKSRGLKVKVIKSIFNIYTFLCTPNLETYPFNILLTSIYHDLLTIVFFLLTDLFFNNSFHDLRKPKVKRFHKSRV